MLRYFSGDFPLLQHAHFSPNVIVRGKADSNRQGAFQPIHRQAFEQAPKALWFSDHRQRPVNRLITRNLPCVGKHHTLRLHSTTDHVERVGHRLGGQPRQGPAKEALPPQNFPLLNPFHWAFHPVKPKERKSGVGQDADKGRLHASKQAVVTLLTDDRTKGVHHPNVSSRRRVKLLDGHPCAH